MNVSQQKFLKKGGNLWGRSVKDWGFVTSKNDFIQGETVEVDVWNGTLLKVVVVSFLGDTEHGRLYLAKREGEPDLSPQIKRYNSSKKVKVIDIWRDSEDGIFEGSGGKEYHASLDSCDCRDFVTRKIPCKHMYKLATELDAFNWPEENQPGWVIEFKQHL